MPPRLLPAVLGVLALLALAGSAAADPGERLRDVDDRIGELNERIAQARAREGVLTEEISAVTEKIRLLEDDVGLASTRLESLERQLALHEEKLRKLTELFRLETARLIFLREQHAEALTRYNRRLVAIYESEDVDTLAVLLSASSFVDLVDQLDYLNQIGDLDRRITGEVRVAKEEMRRARERTRRARVGVARETRAISVKTEAARAERDRLLASQSALAEARADKRATLASVRDDEQAYLHEVEALAAVSATLAAQIRGAQAAASPSVASSTPSASGFIWPVSGPVTSPFGWRWGRMHEGIDISAPSGTPIVAAASGTVISAGWLGGYGNLIVIDHGGGLATAYAHMSGYAASSGQPVAQGQTVGFVGSTGNSTGPHLHFEVRVNGFAVDPLGYL
jgi:murein DD-endopeptidase MepM/ murein hydrolase activator NlpD